MNDKDDLTRNMGRGIEKLIVNAVYNQQQEMSSNPGRFALLGKEVPCLRVICSAENPFVLKNHRNITGERMREISKPFEESCAPGNGLFNTGIDRPFSFSLVDKWPDMTSVLVGMVRNDGSYWFNPVPGEDHRDKRLTFMSPSGNGWVPGFRTNRSFGSSWINFTNSKKKLSAKNCREEMMPVGFKPARQLNWPSSDASLYDEIKTESTAELIKMVMSIMKERFRELNLNDTMDARDSFRKNKRITSDYTNDFGTEMENIKRSILDFETGTVWGAHRGNEKTLRTNLISIIYAHKLGQKILSEEDFSAFQPKITTAGKLLIDFQRREDRGINRHSKTIFSYDGRWLTKKLLTVRYFLQSAAFRLDYKNDFEAWGINLHRVFFLKLENNKFEPVDFTDNIVTDYLSDMHTMVSLA